MFSNLKNLSELIASRNMHLALLLLIPLSLRSALWLSGTAQNVNLAFYDADFFLDSSSYFLKLLFSGEFVAASTFYIKYQVPPYGMLIIAVITRPFLGIMEPLKAVLVSPIIFSSLTCVLLFLIGSRISAKVGLAAWALATFDPYQLQFSITFLDSIMNFFLALAFYHLIRLSKLTPRHIIVISFVFAFAILTKYTAAVFLLVFVVLYALVLREPRKAVALLTLTALFVLSLNFQLWTPEGRQAYMELVLKASQPGTPTFNTLRPPIILGPLDIGVPLAYPWYFATYLGMGYIGFNTLPYLSHLALFATLIYIAISRRNIAVDKHIMLWAATAVLSIVFLPRNYWSVSWSEGFIQGTLVKQFYPYYFIITAPPIALLVAYLLFAQKHYEDESKTSPLMMAPVIAFASFAPLTTVFLLTFPYWNFIFTLIYNYNTNPAYTLGLYAFIATCIIAAYAILYTAIMLRRLKQAGANG